MRKSSNPRFSNVTKLALAVTLAFSLVRPSDVCAQESRKASGEIVVAVSRFTNSTGKPLDVGIGLAVSDDSDIHSFADLKGKKIAYVIGSRGANIVSEVWLAFAGLTWDDVVKVDFPSSASALSGPMEGKCDFYHVNPTGAYCYEWESMPGGFRYIPLPFSDTEGWRRIQARNW